MINIFRVGNCPWANACCREVMDYLDRSPNQTIKLV